MADDGFSGKWTINNEWWFERIEQRLNRINETLCNLTQMVVALTIEGKREPMERRPDQRGDWQEDGYDELTLATDRGQKSIVEAQFTCEPYSLWVYERWNRGAPRQHDDDNL